MTTDHGDDDWWRRYGPVDRRQPHLAALEQFVAFGYHGTSIRAIASAAGMSVPGLYYHFKSKDEILARLLAAAMDDMVQRAQGAIGWAGEDPRDQFVAQVENSSLHTMYRRQEALLMVRELRFLDEPDRSSIVALRDRLEDAFYASIRAATATGQFDVKDVRGTGRAILALCRSISNWYAADGARTPEMIAEQYIAFALKMVNDHGSPAPLHP